MKAEETSAKVFLQPEVSLHLDAARHDGRADIADG